MLKFPKLNWLVEGYLFLENLGFSTCFSVDFLLISNLSVCSILSSMLWNTSPLTVETENQLRC